MSDLYDYEIETKNGVRHWMAEDKEHAREQHEDAFHGEPGERIIAVRRWDKAMTHDIRLVGVDTDGSSVWYDPADGSTYNSGDPLTEDEAKELAGVGHGMIYALLSNQGTAAAETALCAHHYRNGLARQMAYRNAGPDVPWIGTGPNGGPAPFVECPGNDALVCIIGGCE